MKFRFSSQVTLFLIALSFIVTPALASDVFWVKHVSDGDTFVLQDGRKVRMIGVDTPETNDEYRNNQNAKRNLIDQKRVQLYAAKAKKYLQTTIEGQEVRLEYDWQRQDKFGRTLAYVYRSSDDLFVNAEIIKQGYGFAYLQFPFKYSKEFKTYANESKKNRKGLWA